MTDKDDFAGRAALAVDELLTDPLLAPLRRELHAEARSTMPGHLTDQLDTAHTEALDQLDREYTGGGWASKQWVEPGVVPGWVRLGALDTLTAWVLGAGPTCSHAPSPGQPEPLYAAAWRPRLVVCGRCPHLLGCSRVEDRTCDGCGTVVGGVDVGDPMWPFQVQVGVLNYRAGMCSGCRPHLDNTTQGPGLTWPPVVPK